LDDLLALISRGDQKAFAAFYDQTCRRTLGLICRVLKDPAQSEEVAQEVYLELWQHAAQFDSNKSPSLSWLFTIAHRRAIDRVRASQASRNRDIAVGIRNTPHPFDHVTETIETSMEYQDARRALTRLHPKHRAVIELTYDHHLTRAETAERLGIPVGTVKTNLRDGLIALRRELTAA
jgi:RNA polymerase sigma-70 factor (ECF subfamily)